MQYGSWPYYLTNNSSKTLWGDHIMENYKDPQKETVTPYKDENNKEYASPKFSITINSLAEGYKHKYKTYYYIINERNDYIRQCKSIADGNAFIHRCGCTGRWKVKSYTEHEELIQKRVEQHQYQRTYTHKPLNSSQRHKEVETSYYLQEKRRMDRALNTAENDRFKRDIKRKLKADSNIGEMTYEKKEVVQEYTIEQRQKQLAALMG